MKRLIVTSNSLMAALSGMRHPAISAIELQNKRKEEERRNIERIADQLTSRPVSVEDLEGIAAALRAPKDKKRSKGEKKRAKSFGRGFAQVSMRGVRP